MDSSVGRAGQVTASSDVSEMEPEQCWSLLRKHSLGRLAIVVDGRPEIFPVNYAAGEGAVVIRTQPGSKLSHGPGSKVAFEIDGYDRSTGVGWSVVAAGTLEDITDRDDPHSQALRRLPVETVAPGVRLHWLALAPEKLTGRSFRGGWMIPGGYLG